MSNQVSQKLSLAMKLLASALMPAHHQTSGAPIARNEDKSKRQKTKKGAVHNHRPTFLSRNTLTITQAEYRRQHLGVVTIVPNHLKPHPAPRGRNVWTS